MKVVQRGIMKILPGKMEEAMKFLEEWKGMMSRLTGPSFRGYQRLSGLGDVMHTIVFEGEWSSFAAMASFFEKAFGDPEFQKSMTKWGTVLESHEVEFYIPLP